MNSLEVCQLVIVRVDADAEEEARISSVNDLVVPELAAGQFREERMGEVLLRTSMKFDWYFWSLGAIMRWTSPRRRTYWTRTTSSWWLAVAAALKSGGTHLLVVVERGVPLRQARLALPVLRWK